MVATAETVFTEEYWAPLPPLPEYKSRTTLGRVFERTDGSWLTPSIDRANKQLVRERLCLAVDRLIAGETTEPIKASEVLGGENDFQYALPGAAILVDYEDVTFNESGKRSIMRPRMADEAEISLSAVGCLLRGLTSTDFEDPAENYAILNPYDAALESKTGSYSRRVDMYAFCLSKKNTVEGFNFLQWRNEPGSPRVLSMMGRFLNYAYDHGGLMPPTVGETVNKTINPKLPHFRRIREARLCIAGARELSRAKAVRERIRPTPVPLTA